MDLMNKTPKTIVAELDQFVIGQDQAKKAVAVALYNRYRRMQLSAKMQQEITPKNLLMIGPTGVGKTEIARRLAKVVDAPFIKVEATKFTEVGYVGRDVESMVRDLADVAVHMEETEQFKNVRAKAARQADKRLVKLLVPGIKKEQRKNNNNMNDLMNMFNALQKGETPAGFGQTESEEVTDDIRNERLSVKEQLDKGLLDDREIEIQVDEPKKVAPMNDMMGQMGIDLNDTLGSIMPKKKITRTVTVKEAREVFIQEESAKLVNHADIYHDALQRAENTGIIFIDEIDKITAGGKKQSGEVSREGVQRDILPIVEGSQVNTKYGVLKTDHILFIGSGAFAESKPSDLIAELQGRFPIRVELEDLTEKDFIRILTEPNNALVKQYMALIGADGVHVTFTMEAIGRIAAIAFQVNHDTDNIGARRLATILEKLLEDILFEGPDMQMGDITITEQYVNDKIGNIAADKDLTRFIL
ncbi:ATP-dependent protease ATPase subunit HslU [Latilactobacillus curvatus]|uniref:ATP-dependent protease ATPase subunit HslU n=1 Tax=Latilactobacillus curvatus TaxID=28038 RepID=UPI0020C820D3|nr:ATP-dependent protease ATPase subunit HslU [Latilactobacillus curvatus]MCP8848210.1 ATP-dependent protease ATPase subunit HslU [Latilactobacillus curvatus]MCP8864183.1 ATP-dependent protease ATPase subunit HslU [Latilactobacillus curvatus]MCP8873066.1 ATP-dependent protease ATPase subunit HslU [Latilactobacillus curvatus]MCP8874859.1 ATP-dependent protease ATPase subunit HslU [Latilactobacillus curvatus]MCP8878439.1 ATP-dependent protease ATPase subunit HslU [Latilactobacillus curvatus]